MSTATITARLRQESTWRGIIALIGSVAIAVRPDQIAVILPAILGLIGAINVGKND